MKYDLPVPYPEESLFSVLARFRERMRYPQEYAVAQNLFGASRGKAVTMFPSRLERLVSQLAMEGMYTADYFIEHHTLFPLHKPFLTDSKAAEVAAQLRGERTRRLHLLLGITGSDLPLPARIRYCPICARAQRERFTEAYWRRDHQLPGILACSEHGVWLADSGLAAQGHHRYMTLEEWLETEPIVQEQPVAEEDGWHLRLAEMAAWVLRHQPPDSLESVRARYYWMLAERGLAAYTGLVYRQRLMDNFGDYFGERFLQQVHCSMQQRNIHNWLMYVIKGRHGQHPLRHLLLILFLERTAEAFFAAPERQRPFGLGPWPCLNPVCAHYHEAVIEDHALGHNRSAGRRPLATFACACGFVYSRVGPDRTAADRCRVGRIRSYGPVWEAKLRELWRDPDLTITAIARHMGSNFTTIKRQARRLGLLNAAAGATATSATPYERSGALPTAANRQMYRRAWLEATAVFPAQPWNALKAAHASVYNWLDRHDAEWLAAHRPARQGDTRSKVSWAELDEQLAERVTTAVARLKQTTPPVRVSKNRLLQVMGISKNWFGRDLVKLPQTAVVLAQSTETAEEFALRRLENVIRACAEENHKPTKSELIKRAGLSKALQTPRLQARLEEAMRHD